MNGNLISNEESFYSSKKIDIDKTTPTMILARDLYDNSGKFLLPKDTKISGISYEKLKDMGITEIYVKDVKTKEVEKIIEKPKIVEPIPDTKEYKIFEEVYEEKTTEVKTILNDIGNGKTINVNELFDLTEKIMTNTTSKSDVFSYMGFLQGSDESTFSHSNNVALLCNIFASWLNLNDTETQYLTVAGLLHDVGKVEIDPVVLNKKSKLTDEEFAEIKKHTIYGYKILEKQNIPNEIKLAALMHHEKIDGKGYPLRAKHSQISEYAKIVAICDIYDAMTANRIYRKKIMPFDVIETFEQQSYGQLDTKYLLIFLQNIAYNYLGTMVKLSNSLIGEIIFINKHALSKPLVKVKNDIIDLSKHSNITIESFI